MGETDDEIANKVKTALQNNLKPILCIGENLFERENGQTKQVIKNQIKSGLNLLEDKNESIVIAYEPIWAIGSGKAENPQDALEIVKYIKTLTGKNTSVLYGGSVNAKNIYDFIQYQEINGVLVGGASLKPKDFFNC